MAFNQIPFPFGEGGGRPLLLGQIILEFVVGLACFLVLDSLLLDLEINRLFCMNGNFSSFVLIIGNC